MADFADFAGSRTGALPTAAVEDWATSTPCLARLPRNGREMEPFKRFVANKGERVLAIPIAGLFAELSEAVHDLFQIHSFHQGKESTP